MKELGSPIKRPSVKGWSNFSRRFDFLGYRFTPSSADGLKIAGQTINNHMDKIARLYEPCAGMYALGNM